MAYKDPQDERARAARRRHYEKNKSQYYARNERAKQEKLDFLRTTKNVPCMDCGNSYPYYVMDFDHRPGEDKLFPPAMLALRTWTQLRREIAKCDVVCSNCHRVRTYTRAVGDEPSRSGKNSRREEVSLK